MFEYEKYGENPFKIAVIGATHGDETLGVKVIENLKKYNINNITYILANKKAYEISSRYVEADLNRCFLDNILSLEDNKGLLYEEKVAKELDKFLKKFQFIIDLHSTMFDVPGYFIIDKLEKIKLQTITGSSIIDKVYLLDGIKGALISNYNNAIAIEIGHNNNEDNIRIITDTLLEIISNLNIENTFNKEVFKGKGPIFKKDIFKLEEGISDFSIVKKGKIIGFQKNGFPVFAKEDTGILWTNFKDDKILCFKSEKLEI